jgi:hypothetical protein
MVGGADCTNGPGGTFVEVRVSLMGGGMERKYKMLKAEELKPPGVVVTFTKVTTAFTMTGFRLRCKLDPKSEDFVSYTLQNETQWQSRHHIPIPLGSEPKLGVHVEQLADGLLRVRIGVKPTH